MFFLKWMLTCLYYAYLILNHDDFARVVISFLLQTEESLILYDLIVKREVDILLQFRYLLLQESNPLFYRVILHGLICYRKNRKCKRRYFLDIFY